MVLLVACSVKWTPKHTTHWSPQNRPSWASLGVFWGVGLKPGGAQGQGVMAVNLRPREMSDGLLLAGVTMAPLSP